MPIDYKLATRVIDSAMKGVGKGIDSVVGNLMGNYKLPPLAFAGSPDPALYKRTDNAPTLDAYLSDCRNTTKPVTNIPRAKYFLEQLYG